MMDMSWITDRIAVGGGIWTDANMIEVVRVGVTHIIDMQIEFDDTPLAEPYAIEVLWNPTDDDFQLKPPELFRRGVDFENRVYRKIADSHALPFLDIAHLMPSEPLLFADGVHTTGSGVRVKAWAFFRELLPLVEQRLASGSWPRRIDDAPLPTYEVRHRSVHCNEPPSSQN